MNWEFKLEEISVAVDVYQRLRASVGWWPVDESVVAASLAGSLYSVVVTDGEGSVVGMGRIIGDPMYMYVQDMIVLPEHQGLGLGAEMMERILAHADKIGRTGSYLGLMCARGIEPFYARFGFERRPPDGPGMQRIL